MRILHVINIFFSTSYLGDQFKYFSEKGYKQYLICSPSENLREYSQRQKIEYTEMMIMRKISLFNDLLSVFKICKYISKNKIQIVVGHTPKGALLAMMSGYLMNVPKRIYFRHGLVYETMTGFSRKLMITIDRITAYLATQIVCVSPSLAEKSIQDGLNSPKKQLVLGFGTCSGIDAVKKFNPQNVNYENLNRIRNSLGFQSEDLLLGIVVD